MIAGLHVVILMYKGFREGGGIFSNLKLGKDPTPLHNHKQIKIITNITS